MGYYLIFRNKQQVNGVRSSPGFLLNNLHTCLADLALNTHVVFNSLNSGNNKKEVIPYVATIGFQDRYFEIPADFQLRGIGLSLGISIGNLKDSQFEEGFVLPETIRKKVVSMQQQMPGDDKKSSYFE